jgi:hypothetical protein
MKKEIRLYEFYGTPENCPGTVVAWRSLQNWKKNPVKKVSASERERKLKLNKLEMSKN